jgi:hypothetical protein
LRRSAQNVPVVDVDASSEAMGYVFSMCSA